MDPGQETVRWLNFRLDVRLNSIMVNNKPYQGHSRVGQIDERGIGIMIPANLKKGDSAEFQFTLPESANVLQVKAVLKSRTGFRYWFEFSDLSATQKQQISRACKPSDPAKQP